VVGIDSRNILFVGGMIHCVTQQQPIDLNSIEIKEIENSPRGELLKIVNILGMDIIEPSKNQLYFLIYENGYVEKKVKL